MIQQPKKLLEQVHDQIQLRHYSHRTEKFYIHWIKEYIYYFDKKHPVEMGKNEINGFLSYLATERHVSASTQNQALGALPSTHIPCVLNLLLPGKVIRYSLILRAKV